MYFSAICLIFCAFYIHSACCGLLTEKLKLSQVSEACQEGVLTCSTDKRPEIAKVEDISQTVQRRVVTRDELEETEQLTSKEFLAPQKCPQGMRIQINKRIGKQILKTALKTSQQNPRSWSQGQPVSGL